MLGGIMPIFVASNRRSYRFNEAAVSITTEEFCERGVARILYPMAGEAGKHFLVR
jgi:hypothetical protein